MSNFTLFFQLGFRHILEGYDHLLFLLGLVIVTKHWKDLLRVISAFTVAHSTTLVLSALGIISLPSIVTESLICFSIIYVGVENVVRKEKKGRWIVAGSFGLIHGAGFSSHLTDLLKSMLGMGNIWSPLLGFNLGIELGQIVVISVVFPCLWLLRKYGTEDRVVPEISRIIASVGAVLLVFRIWGMNP
ncbi:MAG: HupE/UreJ family protein [Candidatus Kapaibacterium sp.]|jgi:hydrogenase/urease accessory protein HupE